MALSHQETFLSWTFTGPTLVLGEGRRGLARACPVVPLDIASFRTFDANAFRSHRLDARHLSGRLGSFQGNDQKFCFAAHMHNAVLCLHIEMCRLECFAFSKTVFHVLRNQVVFFSRKNLRQVFRDL